jgi:hypothetical protein
MYNRTYTAKQSTQAAQQSLYVSLQNKQYLRHTPNIT